MRRAKTVNATWLGGWIIAAAGLLACGVAVIVSKFATKPFKGRIARDKWVAQAKLIGSEGLAAFRIRAKTNDY